VARAWRGWLTSDAANWRSRFWATFADGRDALRAGADFHAAWTLFMNDLEEHVADAREFGDDGGEALARLSSLRAERAQFGGTPPTLAADAALLAAAPPADPLDVVALRPRERWPDEAVCESELVSAGLSTLLAEARTWHTAIARPWVLHWRRRDGAGEPLPPAVPCPAGIVSLRQLAVVAPARGDAAAWWRLYCAAAAATLRGRCRVCNRCTSATHPVLRVRMCARPAPCRDAHAVLRDYEARDALAASPAALAALATLPKGIVLRRTYRRDEPRRRVLHLRSSVAALLAVHPPGSAPPAKLPKLP
jgi:hypothetical protein